MDRPYPETLPSGTGPQLAADWLGSCRRGGCQPSVTEEVFHILRLRLSPEDSRELSSLSTKVGEDEDGVFHCVAGHRTVDTAAHQRPPHLEQILMKTAVTC